MIANSMSLVDIVQKQQQGLWFILLQPLGFLIFLAAGMAVKRTSFRYRNPSNAPDEAEEMALRYFEETLAEGGQAPSSYVQKVSDTEYRYYQPLFVGDVCLQCHGDPAAMDPAVRETLQAEYPRDLATGYEAGDFRGLVRVTVPAERIEG